MRISKSKFVAGVQCLRRLYWQVHQPELAADPSPGSQFVMEQGQDVGRLARQLFPGGVEVTAGRESLSEAIRITKELVRNPSVPAIFEAAFEYDGVFVRVDILERRGKQRWRLLEVKSKSDYKDHYLYDVGIQSRVVERCGLKLSSSNLVHLNRDYIFQGGSFEVRKLFRVRNLNRQLKHLQRKLTNEVRKQLKLLCNPTRPQSRPVATAGNLFPVNSSICAIRLFRRITWPSCQESRPAPSRS